MKSALDLVAFCLYLAWSFGKAAIETIIFGRTAEEQDGGGYDK